jgi:hypothetical protein
MTVAQETAIRWRSVGGCRSVGEIASGIDVKLSESPFHQLN